ncbi:MAG: sigma-54-dependent Fis family transcriptional regulator, partial [Deltaproteobacteria bacterium]|nr:sigma-54-dependent Fis family transcriptional regulator [Deltaproteobacteria bacterium]
AIRSEIIPQAWEATDFFQNLGGKPRHVFFLAAPIFDKDGKMIGAIETLQDITRRIKAEKELRASEGRYRKLAENVADGVILIQNKTLIFANQAFAGIFGYDSSDNPLVKKVVDLISMEVKQSVGEYKKALEQGQSVESVSQLQTATSDGKDLWVEAHNSVIMWEGEPAILTTLRDVTKTKLQEIAIQEEAEHLRKENKKLRYSIKGQYRFGRIIGKSQVMQEVYDLILKAADTKDNIIIYGETGTGKELVAKEIHNMSERLNGEFVPVNSGAIPESLIEREFFGHKKGAFTGATMDTHGYLDIADGGSLFLDEIGDLSLNMQVKLLRAIEDGGYTPVGSNKVKKSDFRIIAATHKDLKQMVNMGQTRRDFFYRIHVIPIHLPPLRDRKEDIPLLVNHFLQSLSDGEITSIPEEIMETLYEYNWPGNVRELQNMLRRFIGVGSLDFIDLASDSIPKRDKAPSDILEDENKDLFASVEDFEKSIIIKALEKNRWHKEKTALELGISRRTLFRKLTNYGLN